ncbi:NAD-dependent epimerase/dehydratase family protein [Rubrobacter marinus]|uniref:NAD-dependent epimerase/dehydratase family protein n=1 Tax=Rubrobacter marinus TaxID=2653852 RepID=A0A6G8PU35_9ACTN|nr:SDR family oxidoreductase [Rubrobacter marinus]QIN77707.1 NAD-dependent epimerase/dehydratase family protein [Rubrobacter marinus]
MTRRVLVTGATGFVGGHLCPELLDEGWTVRAVVRSREAAAGLPRGVEPFYVPDIGPETDWEGGLEGVDVVAHLAGRAHVTQEESANPLDAYREINVGGTRRLAEACAAAGVRRLVFVSSVKAVGEGAPVAYDEETPRRPEDAYGVSKMEAEDALAEVSARTGLEAVTLRPPLVYGPGVKANFRMLMGLVRKGMPLPLGLVRNERSMVYVRNLTATISHCLQHPAAAGHDFFVADGESPSTRELVTRMGRLMKRPARLVPVPVPLLRLGGRATGRSGQVDRLVGSLTVSTAKIRRLLGWTPRFSLDDGLRETVDWYVSRTEG